MTTTLRNITTRTTPFSAPPFRFKSLGFTRRMFSPISYVYNVVVSVYHNYFNSSINLLATYSKSPSSKYPRKTFLKSSLISSLHSLSIIRMEFLSSCSFAFSRDSFSLFKEFAQDSSEQFPQLFDKIHFGQRFSYFIILMTKFANNWSLQRLSNRPSTFKTVFKKPTLKSTLSRPLSKWFSFSFISKETIIGAVQILIPQSIPLTVFFSIIILGIYPVNRSIPYTIFFTMSLITLIHIIKEVLENQPFFTDSNSSSAITLKTIMFRIKTALNHCTPYLIEPSSTLSVFHSYSLTKGRTLVNQFYTLLWTTKSQLTDIWNKANKK